MMGTMGILPVLYLLEYLRNTSDTGPSYLVL
jgi:hypothetical protein